MSQETTSARGPRRSGCSVRCSRPGPRRPRRRRRRGTGRRAPPWRPAGVAVRGVASRVVGPLGAVRRPVERRDRPPQAVDQRLPLNSLTVASSSRAAASVTVVRVAPLRAGVERGCARQPRFQRERQGRSRAARSSGMPSRWYRRREPESHVPPGHQRERREEVLAELAVGLPRRSRRSGARTRGCR